MYRHDLNKVIIYILYICVCCFTPFQYPFLIVSHGKFKVPLASHYLSSFASFYLFASFPCFSQVSAFIPDPSSLSSSSSSSSSSSDVFLSGRKVVFATFTALFFALWGDGRTPPISLYSNPRLKKAVKSNRNKDSRSSVTEPYKYDLLPCVSFSLKKDRFISCQFGCCTDAHTYTHTPLQVPSHWPRGRPIVHLPYRLAVRTETERRRRRLTRSHSYLLHGHGYIDSCYYNYYYYYYQFN